MDGYYKTLSLKEGVEEEATGSDTLQLAPFLGSVMKQMMQKY